MKIKIPIVIVLLSVLLLSACAPTSAPASPEAVNAPTEETMLAEQPTVENQTASTMEPALLTADMVDTTFDDAANIRSQLAYGIMKLDGTPNAISSEQASILIPFWQAVLLLTTDSLTASEELTAVQDQIVQTLTPAQFQAIVEMKITNTALSAYYAEMGVVMTTQASGVVPGSKKDMSEQDKQATRTANQEAGLESGSGQAARTLLIEKVIEYLSS